MRMDRILYVFPTCMFIGHLKGGGTLVSALLCVLLLFIKSGDVALFWIFSASIVLSLISIEYSSSFRGDDRRIVSDELAGMAAALLFLPRSIPVYISSFILFRFFDIAKPLMIKKTEDIGGAAGIMIDDLVAGLAANIAVRMFIWLL